MSNIKSKIILSKVFSEEAFDALKKAPEDKKKNLEEMLGRLQIMSVGYKSQSMDLNLKPRHRARARDYEQNALGLINGILFALATIYDQDSSNG